MFLYVSSTKAYLFWSKLVYFFPPALSIQFEFGTYTFMEGEETAVSVVLSSPADRDIDVLITSLDDTANGKHRIDCTLILLFLLS